MSSNDFQKLIPFLRELETLDWAERSIVADAINQINLQADLIVDYEKQDALKESYSKYLESRKINEILTGRVPLNTVSDELFANLTKDPRFEYLLIERLKSLGVKLDEGEEILDRWVDRDNRDAMVTHDSGTPIQDGDTAGIPIVAEGADGNTVTLVGGEPVDANADFAIPPIEHPGIAADQVTSPAAEQPTTRSTDKNRTHGKK